MEPRRYLRCLGQPALFSPAGEPVRFRTRKHLALLVYLAVEGRPAQRRDRLAELLWPAVSMAEARHSLATALSVLRPRLGPGALATDRESVTLAPGAVALDLERLLAGDILGSDVTGPLEVAAFLDGFDIVESGEFALWKDRQQARLLPAIKGALIVLIDRCRRTGDSRQIEQLADRMLALDELSEEAVRAKMEARAFAGDRLTALQIFEAWKAKLAEELGAVPSELVEGMAVRLRRRGWERTTLTHIPTVPTDQWRGRPFIGRAAEYRVLYEAWEGMRDGVPGHAMVLGDSGIGKTTLVGRLTTAAGLEGAAISRVQCYDLEREIPYATLGNLIHGLLDRPGVSATPPEALAELARTVPEVRRRFPSIPPPEESQGETARIRLTEAFHQMLLAVAEEHPVILVVDDLHLADDASLAVLHLVMRRSRGQPIMVVLIARPGELPRSPQAARLREAVEKLGIRQLEVPPMTEDESRSVLKSMIAPGDAQPNASIRRTLLKAANGFPMVLEMLVQDWRLNGERSLALSVNAMTVELGISTSPATLFRQVLDRTVQSFDAVTHNVLNLAAILGHRLNDIPLYSIADLTTGQTLTGMSILTTTRILRDNGQGLEFANELLRTAAYLRVPSPLRRVLHSRLADRFIDDARRGAGSLGLEIAWHCLRAGRTPEASSYLLEGAQDAMDHGALDSAERALSTALSHLTAHERDRAVLLLTEVLQEQGRWAESASSVLEHGSYAHSELAAVFRILAEHRISMSPSDRIRADVRNLTSIAQGSASASVRVKAIRAASRLMPDLRDETLASELLGALEAVTVSSLTLEEITQLEVTKAQLHYHSGNRLASLEQLQETILRLNERGVVNSTIADAYTGLGAIRCHEGRYRDAAVAFQKAYEVFARIGNEAGQTSIAAQMALCCGRLGEYSEQIHWSRKARTEHESFSTAYNRLQVTYYEAFALAMKGESTSAVDRMASLEEDSRSFANDWLIQAWKLAKADILYLCGHTSAGLAVAREGTHFPQPVLHAASFAGAFARWLALIGESDTQGRVACEEIDRLHANLEKYDAIDQVEILCAHARSQGISAPPESFATLSARLEQLPSPILDQLRRLGLGKRVV
jgi:DNA-binding SARP family transcriptional activator/tetratricopeptide (TPR) repeat protein